MEILLLFPHQLFRSNQELAAGKTVVLIEDALYFRQYAFHKQKLILHRASMRAHERFLLAAGIRVTYLCCKEAPDMQTVFRRILELQPAKLHYIDPVDDLLEQRLLREAEKVRLAARRLDTPMFLSTVADLREFFKGRRLFMAPFYQWQRKRFDILMDGERPAGGHWSFDRENRKRLPKDIELPALPRPSANALVREAIRSVEREFPDNPGIADEFAYPVTYEDARSWLDRFIAERLVLFGDYEDAIAAQESTLFHSVLTPMLNVGLLTPDEVLKAVLAADEVPLNSLEGFVRQLIGWREFMRAAYILQGRRQRTRNFWKHDRALPDSFWHGDTGIVPVDTVIQRVLKHAYAHHIERLMVLGNFMQLCGFRPDDVYRWFMELFIDAYDWVMVPNVYGMALHADGGLITTKPYVGGSNYVLKMSDFPRGNWCKTWDALFWTFIAQHRDVFEHNRRSSMMARQLDRMPTEQRETHRACAAQFLASLG